MRDRSFVARIKPLLTKELEKSDLVSFINPYSYGQLRNNGLPSGITKLYVDGILLVKLLRLAGVSVSRVSFDMTSLAPVIFQKVENEGKDVYFIGAKSAQIESFVENIRRHYPRMHISGFRDGYFQDDEERQCVLNEIVDLEPSIVVVGMGAFLQERFLMDLRALGWQGQGFTCGGFIHQTAGNSIDYYPKYMDKLNLRWLYRIVDEPKLIRRYMLEYPINIGRILVDILDYRLSRNTE